MRTLTKTIGPRVSGTSGEGVAAAYVGEQLKSYGYDVELFEFEAPGFGSGTIVDSSAEIELETVLIAGSAAGVASGPAVFIGLGDAEGVAGRDLTGTVAIALRGTVPFSGKYENAAAAGAVALVVINNAPGLFNGTLGRNASIPVLGVAGSEEDRLRSTAEAGHRLTVRAEPSERAVNVIARASPGGRCEIVVGGHHDTVPGVEGATDNASGTAMTIELARALAADGLDDGTCFVTFGAEESGLHGSRALVDGWEKAGTLPQFMVNLDVVGTGSTVALIGDDELRNAAREIAGELGVEAVLSSLPAGSSSDHASFRSAGVTVIFLTSDDFSDIHTPEDRLERIDLDVLEGLGDVAYELIRELQKRVAQP